MDKKRLHTDLVGRLEAEWKALLASAQEAFDTATDSEHVARSKYETFSLESSYLARGQAERVAGIREELASLRALSTDMDDPDSPIAVGSLVEVLREGGIATYLYLVPAAGGETLDSEMGEVSTVNAFSEYGKRLIGKRLGDSVAVIEGGTSKKVRITEVW